MSRPTLSQRFGVWREDLQPTLRELRYMGHLLRQSPLVMIGIVILTGVVTIAIIGPSIAPFGPTEADFSILVRPANPTSDHLLGVDQFGFDVFSRILHAARLDLWYAVSVTFAGAIIGVMIGLAAGYFGGRIDELVMRVVDVFMAFPGLILAMAVTAALGPSFTSVWFALLLVWWPSYARLARGQALSVREFQYIEAARASGAGSSRIIVRHILPNSLPPILVYATMDMGSVLLVLAGLAFLGFTGSPTVAEWGLMISTARDFLRQTPLLVFSPGLAILLTALGFNLVGDGLRDVLDPRLRR